MSRLEWPKPPEERSYDEGRFAGWDNNGRPIYKETQAGCIINALITFVVLMIIIIITAIHGDSESASILHSILDLFIGLLRIIFIPIYLIFGNNSFNFSLISGSDVPFSAKYPAILCTNTVPETPLRCASSLTAISSLTTTVST